MSLCSPEHGSSAAQQFLGLLHAGHGHRAGPGGWASFAPSSAFSSSFGTSEPWGSHFCKKLPSSLPLSLFPGFHTLSVSLRPGSHLSHFSLQSVQKNRNQNCWWRSQKQQQPVVSTGLREFLPGQETNPHSKSEGAAGLDVHML